MKIPKKPNYKTEKSPSVKEITEWYDFVSLVISIFAIAISLIAYFFK